MADLLRGISASFRTHLMLCGLLVAAGIPLALGGIGFVLLLAAVIWIPLAYRSAKNKLLATTLLLDARQERAFAAKLKTRTWQVLGSALMLPVQMGLAVLGHAIVYGGWHVPPYAMKLIDAVLGIGMDQTFLSRSILPLMLLNLLLPFLYHRKYAEGCFRDAAAQKKVRRLAITAGSVALAYTLLFFLPGISALELYSPMLQKQREAVCFVIEFAPEEAAALAEILAKEEQVRPLPAPSKALREKAPSVYPYQRVLTQYERIPEVGASIRSVNGSHYGGLAVDRDALRLYAYDYARAEAGAYMRWYEVLAFVFSYGHMAGLLVIYGVYWWKRKGYMQPGYSSKAAAV